MEALSTEAKVSSKSRIKFLIVALVLALSYYVYASQHSSYTQYSIEHYFTMLATIEERSISREELKLGAHHLAVSLCENVKLQRSMGNTVSACKLRLETFSPTCQIIVFKGLNDELTNVEEVVPLALSYVDCAGVMWSPYKSKAASPRTDHGDMQPIVKF